MSDKRKFYLVNIQIKKYKLAKINIRIYLHKIERK